MVYIHFALLFACIIYAAKLGGIGVGMAGGFGILQVVKRSLKAQKRSRHFS